MPRKPATSRKTTVYKLRPDASLHDLIADKYINGPGFTVDQDLQFFDRPCLLVSGQFSSRSEAEWCPVVRNYVDTDLALSNATASAALLVQVNSDIFALTYGQGRHFLKQTHVEQNFGFRIALRVIDPDRIREVTRNILDERARVDRNTTPQGQSIERFAIEDYGEIVSRIVGEANLSLAANRESGARVTIKGADALFLPIGRSRADLREDLEELSRISARNEASEELAFLENLRAVKKSDSIYETLQDALAGAFDPDAMGRPSLAYPTNASDDLIEARSYRIRLGGSEQLVHELDLSDLYQPLSEMTRPGRNRALSTGTVQAFSDEAGNDVCSGAIPVNRWIACDLSLGSRQFYFHAGSWFEVGNQYAQSVERRVRAILSRPSETELPVWSTRIDSEGDYNPSVAEDGRFTCLDKTEVKGRLHRRKGIEPCDLVGPDGELIHVKAAERSSPLSHLFNQGRNSAELLLNDSGAREEFLALVEKKGNGRLLGADWRPRRVVFAIASAKNRATSEHLFTFAKVALLRCVDVLNERVTVEVVPIKYE